MFRRTLLLSGVALALVLGGTLTGCDDGHDHEHEDSAFGWAATLDSDAAVNADHSMTITLTSAADGSPVVGATVMAEEPWMDMHGHGSGAKPATTVEVGNGVYTVSNIKFIMPGEWRVKVHATKDDAHEHHDFTFTVN